MWRSDLKKLWWSQGFRSFAIAASGDDHHLQYPGSTALNVIVFLLVAAAVVPEVSWILTVVAEAFVPEAQLLLVCP